MAKERQRRAGPLRRRATTQLPRRPDASALSEAIPLFYIGRNKSGLWVVREAAGGSGGLFLFKQSAARFARRQSEPAGCAMMFLAEPFELDVENQGGRVAGCSPPRAKSWRVARRFWAASSERSSRNGGSLSRRFRTLSQATPASRSDRKGTVPRPVYARLEERRRSADPVIGHSPLDVIGHQQRRTPMRNNNTEPPSCLKPPLFMIGRDARGNWVVQDQNGVRGGLFVDRAEALRYVRFENGNQPGAVVAVSGVLELDLTRRPTTAARPADNTTRERRVA